MKYEVEESIYKISQDHETHEELHEILLTLIHWYQDKTRGEK